MSIPEQTTNSLPDPGSPVAPDAVGRGVLGPGDTEPLTLFVLAGNSLGATNIEGEGTPQWFNLLSVVNLDALGDPVEGKQRIELTLEGQAPIVALWPEVFCAKVVERLQELFSQGSVAPPAAGVETAPETQPPPTGIPIDTKVVVEAPMPGDGPPIQPTANESGEDELVLEHVIYHGGYPGETKKRKKCRAVLDSTGLAVSGASGPDFKLAWHVVNTIEVQNPDEAKFRLNIKVKRDSTSLVVECSDEVTILLEARDVPTLPLRGAVASLVSSEGIHVA